jgi:hypothetical protein
MIRKGVAPPQVTITSGVLLLATALAVLGLELLGAWPF